MDIETILKNHKAISKEKKRKIEVDFEQTPAANPNSRPSNKYLYSEIPDIFFDDILVHYKLSRMHILVLMYLYRSVWCRPNIAKEYGISPMLSIKDIISVLDLNLNEYHQCITHLEALDFLSVIRPGQYFVRRYFTKGNDHLFGQTYDE